jgi:radical SAM superfamily enzyme YgiQ (UPF0313 family)
MSQQVPHILLVNPWIHDFAAFDFWARPLGLLQIASIIRSNGIAVSYIDCLDRFHSNDRRINKCHRHGRGPYLKTEIPKPNVFRSISRKYSRYGIYPQWFIQDLNSIEKPDIIMITSFMTYWYTGLQETIEYIRSVFKDVPIVVGGIYVRLCLDHAKQNIDADWFENRPGEPIVFSIIEHFTGYKCSIDCDLLDLDALPYPAWDLQSHIPFIPILTTRGCPFRCSYCASGFLEPNIRRRSIEHVVEEILYWYQQNEVCDFVFYDDALLYQSDSYAIPLCERIIEKKLALRFHTPNAIHIREINQHIAALMYKAGFKNLRMGLETTDFDHRIDQKLTYHEFETAIKHLKHAGFQKDDMGAYLLVGLPGQQKETVFESIDQVKKTGILPILAYYTPIPHTPLWPKALQMSDVDFSKDLLLTNNTIFPCQKNGFDWEVLSAYKQRIKR